jgi:prenyltransferase beta subunit
MSLVTVVVPPLSGGVGTILGPDYTTELVDMSAKIVEITIQVQQMATQITAMSDQIVALNTQISAINSALLGSNASLLTLNGDMAAILTFLTTVQTPTGEFRTFDFSSTTDNLLVSSALTKTGIPVPPNPGI